MANVKVAQCPCPLPNLLLSTTYALNKSYSKKVIIGLEHFSGFYRAVVKLGSSSSPSKYVTLDMQDWELIMDQMDGMSAYLRNSYSYFQEFGTPMKILLPQHDLLFTQAYGVRAISIDERPGVVFGKTFRGNEPEAQQWEADVPASNEAPAPAVVTDATAATAAAATAITTTTDAAAAAAKEALPPQAAVAAAAAPPAASTSAEAAVGADGPPAKKPRKYDGHPNVVMQAATFEGLRDMRECITEQLKRLEASTGFVNRTVDIVLDVLRSKFKDEDADKVKFVLRDAAAFKQFYTIHKNDIYDNVKLQMEFSLVPEEKFDIILMEMYAFCLPPLAKDLLKLMFK